MLGKFSDPDDECKHLIYPAESCTMCFPKVSVSHVPRRDPFVMSTFGGSAVVAEFDGTCPQCQGRIERNLDEVVMYRGDWVHSECARD